MRKSVGHAVLYQKHNYLKTNVLKTTVVSTERDS
jgi:hypothetical protein